VTAKPQDSSLRDDLVAAIPNMRAFAISLCGNRDRADDLVQEALVKAWNHLSSFQEGTNLKAWLFTILRNAYFSELRKTKREVADSDGQLAARLSVPPEQQGHLDLIDLNRALAQLPPDQREALILVGAEGFSYEDAATISACAVGTVKSRVNRARTRLAELMGHSSSSSDKNDDAGELEPGARRLPRTRVASSS
jgi:RNA polymerase sigma-70 factor (ECF subfamily)